MSILAANLKHLFKELQWHQASEYSLLALLAVSLPLSWRIALWCLILLCANTLIRIFATRHVGNPALDRPTRICLCLMMLFYLVYALSGIYSNNPHEALSTISTMLPLLLFPSCSCSPTPATSPADTSAYSHTCWLPRSLYAFSSCSYGQPSTP